ncbi:urea ABC transporter permease subunit UrtB [Falsiphaeobacter marinintestinus]|uniref:urea ABC transporter permease subunit UrtB n=1 Tax=Falsiphaeobacter marinintestinus TaxID=1492905 RepID=UPI0011B4BD4C|nr:urea ABC transporter permease subunit UrtB [Phaeobacter marinintestinus]
MRHLLAALVALALLIPVPAFAGPVQDLLQAHGSAIIKSSRKTIQPTIDAMAASGLPEVQLILQKWQAREIWQRKEDGQFFIGEEVEKRVYRLTDFDTGERVGDYPKKELKQVKPNSGVQAMIGTALVQFQLTDPDPSLRAAALDSIQRDPAPELLPPLRASIESETDPTLKAQKDRLNTLLTISYGADDAERIVAIDSMAGDLGVDVRATLNPLLDTTRKIADGDTPGTENVAKVLVPGTDLTETEAYDLIVAAWLAPARIEPDDIRNALAAHIDGGTVGSIPVATLSDPAKRVLAYDALAANGTVPPRVTPADQQAALAQFTIYDAYLEPSQQVTDAAQDALTDIELNVSLYQTLDLSLDALSLASIYFLAAIGLAITFGVMGVINMAHGEFIMMGAYTGYVIQQIIPDYTLSIIVAIPVAFLVTFGAGVAMERLVIRWLYHRPLETLLATFGISIALQQIAKNIFGTQARPLTSPAWLDGAWVMNDVVSISYIRIAIFCLAMIFLAVFLFIMNRTRLGLETRAVTQNPRMAGSMGINPDKVNMLTFGLGSGIAGIAGVAIGLYAKVTSELGSDYIVQSFMTVVVGGVGNIWGTLLGAGMIGFLQKGIEWMNPSNTLAAQTYMIIFIIIFIQFRPRGIIALKGRAAGD